MADFTDVVVLPGIDTYPVLPLANDQGAASFLDKEVLPPIDAYLVLPVANDQPMQNFGDVDFLVFEDETVTVSEYLNRVMDSVAGEFVYWVTPYVDLLGVAYPGPGVFGVTTDDYAYSFVDG